VWTPEYFVRRAPFPLSVEGVTLPNDDGSFDIYINALLPPEKQEERLQHELAHIRADHFYREEQSLAACEAEAEDAVSLHGSRARYLHRIARENESAARRILTEAEGQTGMPGDADPATPTVMEIAAAKEEPAPCADPAAEGDRAALAGDSDRSVPGADPEPSPVGKWVAASLSQPRDDGQTDVAPAGDGVAVPNLGAVFAGEEAGPATTPWGAFAENGACTPSVPAAAREDFFPGLPKDSLPHFESVDAFLRYYVSAFGGV